MRQSFKKAFLIFKYLALAFTIGYWIYVVIDDYNFIRQYWTDNWLDYLTIWAMYFLSYFLTFSVYYWVISIVVILVYHKLMKRTVV
ncbi:MAG: hypothetical protein JWM14_2931 [Chitinophagaceae bacterium]|nr:hypothetical protein [Chitinophagaceae bacterium]